MKLPRLLASLTLGLLLLVQVPAAAFAADSSDSGTTASTIGPQGTIGPTGTVGPTGDIGPQGTIGPTGTVGPTGPVGPQPTTTTPSTTSNDSGTTPTTSSSDTTPDTTTTTTGGSDSAGPGSTITTGGTANNSDLSAQISNAQMTLLQNLAQLDATNTDNQQATSGNVSGSDSAQLGDATSGAAMAISNYLNLLNSMWSWASGGLTTFTQNLFGDQTGDINLDPTAANNSNTDAQINNTNNLTINNSPSASITNNITAGSTSGNVDLNDDASVGNATSGDADTDVNLINLINSSIGAGQSFFGMLNVFGNLDGNILFPAGFLTSATPSTVTQGGTSNDSNNTADVTNTNNTTVTNAPTDTFNNNIDTSAQSGAVNASDDAVVGNITSGSANTNSSLFNLLNTNVTGTNAVLVLVNVMGQWMGGIMDLPSTGNSGSALLTSGAQITQNGTSNDSDNTADVNNTNNTTITNTPTDTITNNVNASAQSGDVTATDDASVGNLTSGNANVTTGIANLDGSTLNLSNWFGVLVINVFGNWTGGVNQADATGMGSGATTATPVDAITAADLVNNISQAVGTSQGGSVGTTGSATTANTTTSSVLLASATTPSSSSTNGLAPVPTVSAKAASQAKNTSLLIEIAAGALLIAGAIGSADRRLRNHR
jgi:hypothetical protein